MQADIFGGKAPEPPSLYVHAFRVEEGLGNACILEFPDKTCGIVDWGTQNETATLGALRIASQKRLRFVAATHAHADHTLGLEDLLRRCNASNIKIDKFVYPASTLHKREHYLTRARKAALDCHIPQFDISLDDVLAPPRERTPPYLAWAEDRSWEVRALSPAIADIGAAEVKALGKDIVPGNETSLVLLFRFLNSGSAKGSGRVLLPGDATPSTLKLAKKMGSSNSGLEIDNTVFIVPHHGSQHNLPDWIKDHIHGVAVVSAPTNSRTHPSKLVLEKLGQWTCSSGPPRLFCTSYAYSCAKRFGAGVAPGGTHLIAPGSCFGDLVIKVTASGIAELHHSSDKGEERRPFGYCGMTPQC